MAVMATPAAMSSTSRWCHAGAVAGRRGTVKAVFGPAFGKVVNAISPLPRLGWCSSW